jgi:hypothetical protein
MGKSPSEDGAEGGGTHKQHRRTADRTLPTGLLTNQNCFFAIARASMYIIRTSVKFNLNLHHRHVSPGPSLIVLRYH